MSRDISATFPFESQFIEIHGSDLHYIDVGTGEPILFLHGNPTWSYLWRNVIPHVQSEGRCIAPDLIGMGKSAAPDIDYTFEDHYRYLEAFIDGLNLDDLTLVLHDWGSGLGFRYAHLNPGNVRAMAFMEAIYRPLSWDRLPPPLRIAFRLMRTPVAGWIMLTVANLFVNRMLPAGIERELTREEFERYREPYPTIESRKPVRVWPQEVPIDGTPARVHEKVEAYSQWLRETDLPKLCLYGHPGALIRAPDVDWIDANYRHTRLVDVGAGIHYLQEDHPHRIGNEIASWYGDWS